MRAPLRNVLLALSLLGALPRCAKEPTALFVRVSADPSLQEMLRTARVSSVNATVRVYDADASPDGPMLDSKVFPIASLQAEASFLVESRGQANRVRIDVEVPTLIGSLSDRVLVRYTEDKVLDVSLTFRAACRTLRAPCSTSQRCNASGACEDATVQGTAHPY